MVVAATQAPNLIFIDVDLRTLDYETSLLELNKTLSE
jgi:hypothetical protein